MLIHRAPVVVPVSAPPIRDGAVAVEDGRIVAVGPIGDMPDAPVREHDGVLTPGLVNAHTHLCYSAYADHYHNGKSFFDWIQDFARRNPSMSAEDWHASARLGVDQSLRHGVTGIADVVTPPDALPALLASGMAGTLYFEACFIDDVRWTEQRDAFRDLLDRAEPGVDPTLGVSPHTLYTLGRAVGKDLAAMARERGLRLHPHLAETLHEDSYVRTGSGPFADLSRSLDACFELLDDANGCSPAAEMDAWGLLGADSHVAHGVHLDERDRATLRAHGTHVALCARSNARLEAGEPPVAAHRSERNPVAVGTDSLASAPDLDVAAELPVLRDIARRQGDNGDGLDAWLFHAATRGGALAMGRNDFGVLAPGARADLAVFAVDAGRHPYTALTTGAAGTCVTTILAGHEVERENAHK